MLKKVFDCSLRKHSKKQLEIKMEYPLSLGQKKAVYCLDFYFFFPSQLHINKKRIGVTNFINNMQVNTRFSSPLIPLEKVIDTEFQLSPLTRIENLVNKNELEKERNRHSLLYELQTLCNLYRAETRNFVQLMKKEMKNKKNNDICEERILQMVTTINAFLSRFRKLHTQFLDPHIDDDQRLALNWADESLSIITENGFLNLFRHCQTMAKKKNLLTVITEIVENEVLYRKSMNFRYNYDESNNLCGETMAYRDSILKKWSQSAMYMDNEYSSTPVRISHLIAGIAAALAMLFAISASIYAEQLFPKNSSSWILIIVLSYVFKDRIKEILRASFGNMLPRLTTDQQSNLFDPALKQKAGWSSGTVRFGTSEDIPGAIGKMRFRRPNPFRKILPSNDIIHYKRVIKLNSRILKSNHKRLKAVTEIIRFQIDPWLKDMDDEKEPLFRMSEGERVRINGSRVYRIHLILGLKENRKNGKEYLYHYRIICNKSGIVRIEKDKV